MTHLRIVDRGRMAYVDAHAIQVGHLEARIRQDIDDHLLYFEHPDVVTLGRDRNARDQVLPSCPHPVVSVERGGGATYHGPGQIVGYPIVEIRREPRAVGRFLRALEETLARALAELGIEAGAVPGKTGVWVKGERKIASIGIAVRSWVTWHGFALNVTTPPETFSVIRPCGFSAEVMTSIEKETDAEIHRDLLQSSIGRHLAMALGRAPVEQQGPPSARLSRAVDRNPRPWSDTSPGAR
jgi:lipoyl(octanoyl) transferase